MYTWPLIYTWCPHIISADLALQGPGPLPSEENPYPSPFGHRYFFTVKDTVTEGAESGEVGGNEEFLAFQSPILRIAAHYRMVVVCEYADPALEGCVLLVVVGVCE
jgi:hypothetical protein